MIQNTIRLVFALAILALSNAAGQSGYTELWLQYPGSVCLPGIFVSDVYKQVYQFLTPVKEAGTFLDHRARRTTSGRRLVRYPEIGHMLGREAYFDLLERSTAWFDRFLKPEPVP